MSTDDAAMRRLGTMNRDLARRGDTGSGRARRAERSWRQLVDAPTPEPEPLKQCSLCGISEDFMPMGALDGAVVCEECIELGQA